MSTDDRALLKAAARAAGINAYLICEHRFTARSRLSM